MQPRLIESPGEAGMGGRPELPELPSLLSGGDCGANLPAKDTRYCRVTELPHLMNWVPRLACKPCYPELVKCGKHGLQATRGTLLPG
jgi:hypothetical protein